VCKAQIKHKLVKERGMEGMEERKSAKKGKCVQERGGGGGGGEKGKKRKERREGRRGGRGGGVGEREERRKTAHVHKIYIYAGTCSRAHSHSLTRPYTRMHNLKQSRIGEMLRG